MKILTNKSYRKLLDRIETLESRIATLEDLLGLVSVVDHNGRGVNQPFQRAKLFCTTKLSHLTALVKALGLEYVQPTTSEGAFYLKREV